MKTTILGTEYEFEIMDLNHPEAEGVDGKCFIYDKKILVRDPEYLINGSKKAKRDRFKHVLLHELIHACAKETFSNYDEDENLVDWIADIIPVVVQAYVDLIKQIKEGKE